MRDIVIKNTSGCYFYSNPEFFFPEWSKKLAAMFKLVKTKTIFPVPETGFDSHRIA